VTWILCLDFGEGKLNQFSVVRTDANSAQLPDLKMRDSVLLNSGTNCQFVRNTLPVANGLSSSNIDSCRVLKLRRVMNMHLLHMQRWNQQENHASSIQQAARVLARCPGGKA
jgi:hypothetical protein